MKLKFELQDTPLYMDSPRWATGIYCLQCEFWNTGYISCTRVFLNGVTLPYPTCLYPKQNYWKQL